MTQPLRIGVGGALGRMGQVVTGMVGARADAVLAGLFDRPGSAGEAAGSHVLAEAADVLAASDVVIDFSTPSGSVSLAEATASRGGPRLVIGATGLTPEDIARIDACAAKVAIVRSGNYSLGLNLLAGLVEQAARQLAAADWDIEVFEAHHRRKVDAPSGTALMLGEAAAAGRGIDLSGHAERGRDGITGARKAGAIGFASSRAGGIIGEHSITFASDDEILTFSHSARDRSLFARGALQAAMWIKDRPPGRYDMKDVLGFR